MRSPNTIAVTAPRLRCHCLLPLLGALALTVGGCTLAQTQAFQPGASAAAAAVPAFGSPLQKGDAARSRGDFAAAAAYYRSAHQADPKALQPAMRLAESLLTLKDYAAAAAAYGDAATLAPKNAEAHWRLGELLLLDNKPADAVEQLKTALTLRPGDARLYNAIGVAYGLMGRYDLAKSNFTAGLRIAPDHIPLRDNLGLTQFLAGDFAGATTTLSAVAKLPQAVRSRQNLAMIYALHGDMEKARETARHDLDPAAVEAELAYYRTLAAKGPAVLAKEGAALFGVHFSADAGGARNAQVAARPSPPAPAGAH